MITTQHEQLILPFNLAVAAAAVQNFERDVRMHFTTDKEWFSRRQEYLEDAIDILLLKNRNNEPIYLDHKQIIFSTKVKASNSSSIFLKTINVWYSNKILADIAGYIFTTKKPTIELFYY